MMKFIKFGFIFLFLFSFVLLGQNNDSKEDEIKSTRTKIGQIVPNFTFTSDDGNNHTIQDFQGKIVVINFFANWCSPCRAEFPHLEKEIWQKFKNKDFYLIAIGREHNMKEVQEFKKKMKVSFPMAPDSARTIYSLFADKYIPRTIVVDKKGTIIAQVVGFNPDEFNKLIQIIESKLD